MFLWHQAIDTIAASPELPRMTGVASETQCAPSYHHEGALRAREQHCLFKYTLSGAGAFRDARGVHRVPAGCGFLCTINDPETAYFYPPDGQAAWTFVYACIAGTVVRTMVADMTPRSGPLYYLPGNRGIMAQLLDWGRAGGGRMELSVAESARLTTDLLYALLAAATAAESGTEEARCVRQALDIIDAHLEERLTAGDVADALHISREHFTRLFSQRMGQCPYQYMLRRKVQQACIFLKEGRLANKEIAARLGFSDPAHFTRAFKGVIGMSPQVFRLRGSMPSW